MDRPKNNKQASTEWRHRIHIFDVGAELDHTVSDAGRTFPVSGSFTPEQRRILEMEIGVADAIIEGVRPGVTFSQLMDVTYKAIPEAQRKTTQTGSFFGHHIRMSLGTQA